MVSTLPGTRAAELFVLYAEMPVVRHRFAAVLVVGDQVVVEHDDELSRPSGVRAWLAYAREARSGAQVASLTQLDELLGHLHAGLRGTATVIPLRRAGAR